MASGSKNLTFTIVFEKILFPLCQAMHLPLYSISLRFTVLSENIMDIIIFQCVVKLTTFSMMW